VPSSLRYRHAQHPAEARREVERVEGVVGIADAPELLRVADRARGDQVQAVALGHGHLDQQGQGVALGQETAALIGDSDR
jgi:hypothetical protein